LKQKIGSEKKEVKKYCFFNPEPKSTYAKHFSLRFKAEKFLKRNLQARSHTLVRILKGIPFLTGT
jgi:hypothetical protein